MGSAIEFSVVEKTKERYWDDAEYREENGVEDLLEALDMWEAEIIEQWNTFEHHRRSGLFSSSAYGRDYAEQSERYLEFPEIIGGSYRDGREDAYDYPIKERLREALSYRIDKGDSNDAGWKVFDKVTGTYKINIVDNETHARRRLKLQEFIDIVNRDTKLTTIDPQTGKTAITSVDPSTSQQTGIEYFFPPHDDYSEIHYAVFEPEDIEIKTPYEDINIFDLVNNLVMKQIIERNDLAQLNSVMGQIMSKRKDLREMAKSGELPKMIGESISKYNKIFSEDGVDSIESDYNPIEDVTEEDISETRPMEQKYKIIGLKALIKKASGEVGQKLNDIRPSVGDDSGGPRWPKSGEGTYLLKITNNPFDVITKSTGRPWGWKEESCEVWYGCYKAGPVDDIKWGNPVVWLYQGDEIKPNQENLIGRMMLRWGRSYKRDASGESRRIGVDVGIEAQTYPKQADWGNDVTIALIKILKTEGLLDYDNCRTPYSFKGYSDYAGGAGKITYEQIRLKGKGEIVDETFDYLTQARDPLIGYQQLQWLIQTARREERNDIYGALCQNPTLWAYPSQLTNVIRLLKRLGPEEAKENVLFLIDSEGADLNFFEYVIDHIQDYDEEYRDYQKSLLITILQNPNCPPSIHNKIRLQFPSFIGGQYSSDSVGGVDEIAYLNLMGRSNHWWEEDTHTPFICPAPSDIVTQLVQKITEVGPDLEGYRGRRDLYKPIPQIRYSGDFDTSEKDVEFYWMHRDLLLSVRNLIYAPNITQEDFIKLLKYFYDFMSSIPNWKIDYPVCSRLLKGIRDDFRNCITLPFREQGDYGYTSTLSDGTYVGMGEVPIQFHYHLQERQDAESIGLLLDLYSIGGVSMFDREALWQSSYGLLNNIRSSNVLNTLWRMKERWEVSPELFLNAGRGRSITTKNNPTFNAYITPDVVEKIIEEIVSLSDESEFGVITPKLRSICDFEVSVGQKTERDYSTVGTSTIVDYILVKLERTKAIETIDRIGWNVFALWLEKPIHFNLFENALFEYIFGEFWQDIVSANQSDIVDDWLGNFEYMMTSGADKIQALILAASGGVRNIGGLANNPNLPTPVLMRLIGDDTNTQKLGVSWLRIDDRFQGNYYQYLNLLVEKLLRNPATPSDILGSLVIKYPQYESEVAMNPNAPVALLAKLKAENPIGALCNPNLGSEDIDKICGDVLDILNTREVEDAGRLFDVTTHGNDDIPLEKAMRREVNPLAKVDLIRRYLSDLSWMRYWRGGTCLKKMNLPTSKNLNPMMSNKEGREGIPQAVVELPSDTVEEYIVKNQLIIDMDFDNQLFKSRTGDEELPNIVRFRKIEETTVLPNGKIHVIGQQKTISPQSRGRWGKLDEVYEGIDEMYGYISETGRLLEELSPQIEVDDAVADIISQMDKWTHSLTLVLMDTREDFGQLPLWRRTWNSEDMANFYKCIVTNPATTDITLLKILSFLKRYEGNRINASEREPESRRARFKWSQGGLLATIDSENRWTSLIQRTLFPQLVNHYEPSFIGNYHNCKPSSKIFEYTLLEREPDEDEISMQGFLEQIQQSVMEEGVDAMILMSFDSPTQYLWDSLSGRDLVNWILNGYGLQVPISYIYALMKFRVLYGDSVKSRAREIQRERIPEYIAYVASLHHEGEGEGMIIEA